MTGLVNRGWTLPYPERLLTHTLQKAGYTAVLAGFQHVVADVNHGGFTRLLPEEAPASKTEERAAAFLAEDHRVPFYLDVGFGETHRQGRGFAPQPQGEEPTDPRYVPAPRALPRYPRDAPRHGRIHRRGPHPRRQNGPRLCRPARQRLGR